MPIDPNEALEGTIAVEHAGEKCPGEICVFFLKRQCNQVKCHAEERKDKTNCYFIKKPQPTETKPMEDEYEISTADTAEEAKKIIDWIFSGRRVEVQFPTYWQPVIHVTCGALRTYRVKKIKRNEESSHAD